MMTPKMLLLCPFGIMTKIEGGHGGYGSDCEGHLMMTVFAIVLNKHGILRLLFDSMWISAGAF